MRFLRVILTMTAAVAGHEAVVELLLSAGAHVEGVVDVVDMAHGDGLLSDEAHQRMRTCCASGSGSADHTSRCSSGSSLSVSPTSRRTKQG